MELAALDGRDDIGGRPRRGGLRDDDGSGRTEHLGHCRDGLQCLGLGALGEIVAGDGDTQIADAFAQFRHGQLGRPVGAYRVVGVAALHGVERQREVGDRARERPQMVEGVDEGEGTARLNLP